MSLSSPFQVIVCGQTLPCDARVALDSARETRVQARLLDARERMLQAGLWSADHEPLLVVLDAPLTSPLVAMTVEDAAMAGLPHHAGRQAVLLSGPRAEQDIDILLHELAHVWLRAQGPASPIPRWQRSEDRAHHESGLIHEALADFVAASLTGDALIGEHTLAPGHVRSLGIALKCPDDLTGSAHSDALLISHPLWELSGAGQDASAAAQVLRALVDLPPHATQSIPAFLDAVSNTLASQAASLSERWQTLIESSQLHLCDTPLALTSTPRIAREDAFVAPGMHHFPDLPPPRSPIVFEATLAGARELRISLRSTHSEPALSLHWRAMDADQDVLAEGLSPVEGWPSQFLALTVPEGSQMLRVSVINQAPHDIGFNALRLQPDTQLDTQPDTAQPMHEAGLAASAVWLCVPLMLALGCLLFLWKRKRR